MSKELLRQVKPARRALALAVCAGVGATLLLMVQMTLISGVVSRVFLAHAGLADATPALAALLGALAARAGLLWLQEDAGQRAAIRVKGELRERLFAHLLSLGPTYASAERSGELVATAVDGVERLDAYVSRYLPQIALSAITPLVVDAYVWTLDWASAVLLLVTGPIIPLLMVLIGRYAESQIQRQWLALARLSAHFLDSVQGLTTLQLLGQGKAHRGRIERVSRDFGDRTMQGLRIAFLSGMVLELMSSVAIALVAVTLGIRLLDGGIAFQRAFLVLLLAPEFYRPLRDLGTHRHAGMEGSAAARRIFEILATRVPAGATSGSEPEPTPGLVNSRAAGPGSAGLWPVPGWTPGRARGPRSDNARAQELAHPDSSTLPRLFASAAPPENVADDGPSAERAGTTGCGCRTHRPILALTEGPLEITLAGVTYTYPGRSEPALSDVSAVLAAGRRTALVGRSGAGKTTLVNLLLRFITTHEGCIYVNGAPLDALPVEEWRNRVALVPQRPHLFDGNVRDNICLARPSASQGEVERTAELAGADEFIATLPRGYDTPLGERGSRLSAGQAQRIAIARAFLKDAPLLVLDEPTSALDPDAETRVRAALDRLMEGRTVLVVAHRLNTIRGADQVVVLDQGRIAEPDRPSAWGLPHADADGLAGPGERIGRYAAEQSACVEATP